MRFKFIWTRLLKGDFPNKKQDEQGKMANGRDIHQEPICQVKGNQAETDQFVVPAGEKPQHR